MGTSDLFIFFPSVNFKILYNKRFLKRRGKKRKSKVEIESKTFSLRTLLAKLNAKSLSSKFLFYSPL